MVLITLPLSWLSIPDWGSAALALSHLCGSPVANDPRTYLGHILRASVNITIVFQVLRQPPAPRLACMTVQMLYHSCLHACSAHGGGALELLVMPINSAPVP